MAGLRDMDNSGTPRVTLPSLKLSCTAVPRHTIRIQCYVIGSCGALGMAVWSGARLDAKPSDAVGDACAGWGCGIGDPVWEIGCLGTGDVLAMRVR